jgi:hypothetical protein
MDSVSFDRLGALVPLMGVGLSAKLDYLHVRPDSSAGRAADF